MIEGIIIEPLKQFMDERGKVMHMLRADSPLYSGFGEIYFSFVNPGVVKAWKRHKRMTLNYAVPVGNIKVVVFDDREGSSTKGRVEEYCIGQDNYCLLKIPPMVWTGFKGISIFPSLIANCADLAHDPLEVDRVDVYNSSMPYDWALRHG